MQNSTRYRELTRRLAVLRANLLPKSFSPTGEYSDRQLDRARAYRLLVHAEIEAFAEDIARSAVIAKLNDWKKTRAPSSIVVCLLASYHQGFAVGENELYVNSPQSRPKWKERVDEIIEVAGNQYMRHVSENHGVRADNLRRLFLPVGVEFDLLDATWLTNIDEFGKRRGEIAHKSIGAQQSIDPRSEYAAIQDLQVGLRQLDSLVLQLTGSGGQGSS